MFVALQEPQVINVLWVALLHLSAQTIQVSCSSLCILRHLGHGMCSLL